MRCSARLVYALDGRGKAVADPRDRGDDDLPLVTEGLAKERDVAREPREVVDQGRAISARGVEQVETALSNGWIRVATLTGDGRKAAQRISRISRLHESEAESIALAHARRDLLIVDDKEL